MSRNKQKSDSSEDTSTSASPDFVTVDERGHACNEMPIRQTAGRRLGQVIVPSPPPVSITNNEQNGAGIRDKKLDQLTQRLKECTMRAGGQLGNAGDREAGSIIQTDNKIREFVFDPPWATKVGQLQATCVSLRRYSSRFLETKGSAIIRCYPQKNVDYMRLVCDLVYLVVNNEFLERPSDMHSIPLSYEDDQLEIHNTENGQWAIANRMLLRVRFSNEMVAQRFLNAFNIMARTMFGSNSNFRAYIPPFSHPDLIYPERRLHQALQKICREKNIFSGARNIQFNLFGHNRNANYRHQQPQCQRDFYFHDGVRLFKKRLFENAPPEMVPMEPNTELHHLQAMIYTIRKYSSIREQKKLSVIIRGLELTEGMSINGTDLTAEDYEKIGKIVFSVVMHEEFQKLLPGASRAIISEISRIPRQHPLPSTSIGEHTRPPPPPLVRVTFQTSEAAVAFLRVFYECTKGRKNGNTSEEPCFSGSIQTCLQMRAHRDLTPPELAMFYTMRDFCRQKNEENKNNLEDNGEEAETMRFYFFRNTRVFEKEIPAYK